MSQTVLGTAKESGRPTRGSWTLYAGGQKGYLDITLVTPDHRVEGTLTVVGQFDGRPAYTSRIFGFWDPDAWKIMFLKENEMKPTSSTRSDKWADPTYDCNRRDPCYR